jgi:PAS domain-containing protein
MRQFRLDMGDAPVVWVNCTLSAVRNPDGTMQHVFGVLKDITPHKLTEEEFARQHALFSRISQNSPVGLVHLEPDGGIGFANLEANRIFGLCAADAEQDRERFLAIRWRPAGEGRAVENAFVAFPSNSPCRVFFRLHCRMDAAGMCPSAPHPSRRSRICLKAPCWWWRMSPPRFARKPNGNGSIRS